MDQIVTTSQPKPQEEQQGNDNLSNDNVKVAIKPETDDNKVNINFCSFNCFCNMK
jgi:hypothetical protein